jgi:hypothetical protein
MSRYDFKGERNEDEKMPVSANVWTELHEAGIRSAWFWELRDVLEACEEMKLDCNEDTAEALFYFKGMQIQEAMRVAGRNVILELLYRAGETGVIDDSE